MCFQLGTSPPHRSMGCATLTFRVGFRLLSRPPRHNGGTRQFLTGGLPSYSVYDSSNYFLRVFPSFIARLFRGVGVGFEEPHLRFMV